MKFDGDLLIEVVSYEHEILDKNGNKTGKKVKFIPGSKIKIYSKNDEGEYHQLGVIAKLKLEASTDKTKAIVEATIPEQDPRFSDNLRKSLAITKEAFLQAGAEVKEYSMAEKESGSKKEAKRIIREILRKQRKANRR